MPKIPTYVSDGGLAGVAQPMPHGGYPNLAQPFEALTQTAVDSAAAFMQASRKAHDADEKLDMEIQFNALKADFAEREILLKRQGMNPDEYPQAAQNALTQAYQRAEGSLKYGKDSAQKFRALATPYLTTQLIDSRKDAEKIRFAQMETAAEVLTTQDESQAVLGNPEERIAALQRITTRTQGLVNQGVYSGAKGASVITGAMQRIEEGGAIRDSYEPDLLPDVMRRLTSADSDAYKNIPVTKRLELGKQIADRVRQEQDRDEKKAEKFFKDGKDQAISDLTSQANPPPGEERPPTPVLLAKLEDARRAWRMSGSEYETLRNIIVKEPDEVPSNPQDRDRFMIGSHGEFPTVTQAQIDESHRLWQRTGGAQGLNAKDAAQMKDKVASSNRSNRAEARTVQSEQYTNAVRQLKADLGIPDIAEKIEGTQAKLYAQGLEMISQADKRFGGSVSGDEFRKHYDTVIRPSVLSARDKDLSLDVNDRQKILGDARPAAEQAQDLEQRYAAGLVKKAEYDTRKRQILQLRDAENAADQVRADKEFKQSSTGGKRR